MNNKDRFFLLTLMCNSVPLPQEVCKHLQKEGATGIELIENLVAAVNVYFNFTGEAKCLNTHQQATGNLGDQGWDFQVIFRRINIYIFFNS